MIIATYGTLRRGGVWHGQYEDSMRYLGTHDVPGYNLYDLGPYPAATVGTGILTIDLFEVDNDTFGRLNHMEVGAGYHRVSLKVDGDDASMWLYRPSEIGRYERQIEPGDYIEYLRALQELEASRGPHYQD